MAPKLSVIVPVYREPLALPRCLAHLAGCPRIGECEVIVSAADEGASAVPPGILPVRTVRSPAGRGRQLDAGARAARAAVLVFLHVDTVPPRDFVRLVLEATGREADRAPAPARSRRRRPADAGAFDLHIDSSHPVVRAITLIGLLRSRLTRVPYGDQVHFATREAYEAVGGYPHLPIMEDVAFMRLLARAGRRVVLLRPPARTSARRWMAEGPIRTTLRNWRITLAYRSGVSPRTLRARYRPQWDVEPDTDSLIVFHRALRPRCVKTRLAAALGDRTALALYRAMLDDLSRETRAAVGTLRGVRTLWFIDDPAAGYDTAGGSYPQIGDDLWDRMRDAMGRAIAAGARRVVLVGSDIPALDRKLLRRAFAALRAHDVVVGPSPDGGFYLVGCAADVFDEALFAEASRDADRSGPAIVDWARRQGYRAATLPPACDVDTAADLTTVLADPSVRAPALRRAVRRAGLAFPILDEGEDA